MDKQPEDQLHAEGEEGNAEPVYYWNSGANAEVDAGTKAWHWTCWTGRKVFEGMEFSGEVIATFLGLTRSKYDWILETKEREDQEKALRLLEKKQRRQLRLKELLEEEKRKLQELEHGVSSIAPEKDILL